MNQIDMGNIAVLEKYWIYDRSNQFFYIHHKNMIILPIIQIPQYQPQTSILKNTMHQSIHLPIFPKTYPFLHTHISDGTIQIQQMQLYKGLIILLLFTISYTQNRFHLDSSAPYSSNRNKLVFSGDQRSVIFYGNDENVTIHEIMFDFRMKYNINTTAKPIYLQTFSSETRFLSSSQDKWFRKSNCSSDYTHYSQELMKRYDCAALKVSPAPDQQFFAAYCPNSTKIFTGSMIVFLQNLQDLPFGFIIEAMRWHPIINILAVAGTKAGTKQYHLLLLDTRSFGVVADFSERLTSRVVDVEFSDDGNRIAVIMEGSKFITIWDIVDQKYQNFLVAVETTGLKQMKRSGKMLTAYDEAFAYVWVFDGANYGKYPSILKSPALTPSGGELVTLDGSTKQLKLWKICETNQVFTQNGCTACAAPCVTCFGNVNSCSSCVSTYGYDYEKLVCFKCIDNCKTCEVIDACATCLENFFYEGKACLSCFAKYPGCSSCNANKCLSCSTTQNWELGKNGNCQCKQGFVGVDKKCLACPNHCISCSNPDTCIKCNSAEHRTLIPSQGSCGCQIGFFQTPTSPICLTCIAGCAKCDNEKTCIQCNTDKNWVMDKTTQTCSCKASFFKNKDACQSCSSHIKDCKRCNGPELCLQCEDNHFIQKKTGQCIVLDGGNMWIVLVIGVLLIIASIFGYFFTKRLKQKKQKKTSTLLQSEALNDLE